MNLLEMLKKETELACPICEFEYIHLTKVINKNGGCCIEMECEDGHTWNLVIIAHEGTLSIQVVPKTVFNR